MRLAINGFDRMGRLALRALAGRPELDAIVVVAVNEPEVDAETMALLLELDSVQGPFGKPCQGACHTLHAGARCVVASAPVRGVVTTIHDSTDKQGVQDAAHKDPRRARA